MSAPCVNKTLPTPLEKQYNDDNSNNNNLFNFSDYNTPPPCLFVVALAIFSSPTSNRQKCTQLCELEVVEVCEFQVWLRVKKNFNYWNGSSSKRERAGVYCQVQLYRMFELLCTFRYIFVAQNIFIDPVTAFIFINNKQFVQCCLTVSLILRSSQTIGKTIIWPSLRFFFFANMLKNCIPIILSAKLWNTFTKVLFEDMRCQNAMWSKLNYKLIFCLMPSKLCNITIEIYV